MVKEKEQPMTWCWCSLINDGLEIFLSFRGLLLFCDTFCICINCIYKRNANIHLLFVGQWCLPTTLLKWEYFSAEIANPKNITFPFLH